eukprot:Skav203639  [mRNA]  locus=scaffold1120:211422:213020:+ [translate_table: standard]
MVGSSLVDEIETPSEVESARIDSHVLRPPVPGDVCHECASHHGLALCRHKPLVPDSADDRMEGPRLVYTELELSLLLSMALLSMLNVLQAAVNFDYYASKWIRTQYETLTSEGNFRFQFQVLHHAYRFCEIAVRILTLLLVAEALRRREPGEAPHR